MTVNRYFDLLSKIEEHPFFDFIDGDSRHEALLFKSRSNIRLLKREAEAKFDKFAEIVELAAETAKKLDEFFTI